MHWLNSYTCLTFSLLRGVQCTSYNCYCNHMCFITYIIHHTKAFFSLEILHTRIHLSKQRQRLILWSWHTWNGVRLWHTLPCETISFCRFLDLWIRTLMAFIRPVQESRIFSFTSNCTPVWSSRDLASIACKRMLHICTQKLMTQCFWCSFELGVTWPLVP